MNRTLSQSLDADILTILGDCSKYEETPDMECKNLLGSSLIITSLHKFNSDSWNSLLQCVVEAENLTRFKRGLEKLMQDRSILGY